MSGFVLQPLMTEETQRLINSLREKTATIQKELVELMDENVSLKEEMVRKQVEFDESQIKLSELNQRYNALKIAKSLQSGDNNQSLKKRINAMVKEINTCIELIDE